LWKHHGIFDGLGSTGDQQQLFDSQVFWSPKPQSLRSLSSIAQSLDGGGDGGGVGEGVGVGVGWSPDWWKHHGIFDGLGSTGDQQQLFDSQVFWSPKPQSLRSLSSMAQSLDGGGDGDGEGASLP
jgi:hypothetical protein